MAAALLGTASGCGQVSRQARRSSGPRRRSTGPLWSRPSATLTAHSRREWAEDVREATGGTGADVVLDGVGGATGASSFGAVARGGRFPAYGASAGGFTRVDRQRAGEREVSVRNLLEVPMEPGDHTRLAEAALADAAAGGITPTAGQTCPIRQARDARTAIKARTVVGTTLLLP